MSRIRSFTFPRFRAAKMQEEDMSGYGSPYQAHSRNSSSASSASSPITSTFSNHSHNRWPSSSSSLATSPDSPMNVTKSALHDVVEDPAGEDAVLDAEYDLTDEPLCICDTTFCEHRRTPNGTPSASVLPSTPEWTPGDDSFGDCDLPGERSSKRRKSGEYFGDVLASRLSRRWPSISHRWKEHKSPSAVSSPTVRSAPHSRSSSIRLPSLQQALANHIEPATLATPPYTPANSQPDENVLSRPRAISRPQRPQDIQVPRPVADPINRQDLASTPLLPPMFAAHLSRSSSELQSPLQSPTIADPFSSSPSRGTPTLTPVRGSIQTPPLSSRPSVASIDLSRSNLHRISDPPHLDLSEEPDHWATKLGHANFYITPEPYYPDNCNLHSCERLRNDWESARREYYRVAAHVSEHYGPTSQTCRFTEQKWAEIDSQWRSYHERATAEAGANYGLVHYQPLGETQSSSRLPILNDPQQPDKFPAIADSDIVGPMVQYAKIQRRPSRRPTLLKLFTDPISLIGGRSPFSLRR